MEYDDSLQFLCLTVIALEFDTFRAFKHSDDTHLRRQFQFLEKFYPYEILLRLGWFDELEEEYVDVLVNKYIEVLHTRFFDDVPWETVIKKFAEVGSNITEIIINDHKEARAWQHIFPYLSNLEIMYFEEFCNDEILRCIAQFCPNITEIEVPHSPITNEGIKYLCMTENGKPLCPKLKKVIISNTHVDFEGVHYLVKNLKTLEETDYHYISKIIVQSQVENYFSGLQNEEPYNLKSLNLLPIYSDIQNPTYFKLCHEICLTLCPRLKSLTCFIEKDEHLNLFPYELKDLNLFCSSDSKINITNFLKYKGRTLRYLFLSDCFLSVGTLAESCPCLMHLEMQNVHFTNDKFSHMFHHLNICTFEDTINESATVKAICLVLTSAPKLRTISFKTCNVSSRVLNREILKACKYYPRKEVYFSNSAVGMDFAKEFLKDCHSLQVFELKNCDVNKKDAVEFHSFVQTLPNIRVVLDNIDDIDEEDKVDFKAELYFEIAKFVFSKSI